MYRLSEPVAKMSRPKAATSSFRARLSKTTFCEVSEKWRKNRSTDKNRLKWRIEEVCRFLCVSIIVLGSKAVQSVSLVFQCVNNVRCHESIAFRVLRVCCCIAYDFSEEIREDLTRFVVDQVAETLDTAAASQTANCWLGDALNVVAHNFAWALGTTLSESFCWHVAVAVVGLVPLMVC